MTIGSLAHVASTVSRLIDLPLEGSELNLTKLTGEDNIWCLCFVMVTRNKADGHYSYLVDTALVTYHVAGDRFRTGCFVFNKGVWDLLNAGHYKYWFAVVNGELRRLRKCSVNKLFNTLNIKLTKHNTDHLVRDIDYPDLDIRQDYLPGRPSPKMEYVQMLKSVIATVRVHGRQTNITFGDALKHLGPQTPLVQLEEHVKLKQREKKEFDSVTDFFSPVEDRAVDVRPLSDRGRVKNKSVGLDSEEPPTKKKLVGLELDESERSNVGKRILTMTKSAVANRREPTPS